jgi:hypothetical protein
MVAVGFAVLRRGALKATVTAKLAKLRKHRGRRSELQPTTTALRLPIA